MNNRFIFHVNVSDADITDKLNVLSKSLNMPYIQFEFIHSDHTPSENIATAKLSSYGRKLPIDLELYTFPVFDPDLCLVSFLC